MCKILLSGDKFPKFVEEYFRLAEKYGRELDLEVVNMSVDVDNLIKSLEEVSERVDINYEVLYKYEGEVPQRSFCQRMMSLNKFYTKEEINIMSFRGDNRQFGHKGQNYSIWEYAGGAFCKHYWAEYLVVFDENGKATSAVNTGPVNGKPGEPASASNRWRTHPNGRFKNL